MNNTFVNSMIWCWMLVLLATSPAHAFYHTDKQSEGPIFQKERCYEAWDTGERAFALYDNLDCPLDKLSQGSLICPRSDKFVPADVYMGNIPLRIAIRPPLTVENSFDALVHANLIVKKLIEEQEAQQERAREILAGLKIPFVDFRMSFLERTRKLLSVKRYERSLGQTSTESLTSFRSRPINTGRAPIYLSGRPISGSSGEPAPYIDNGPLRRTGSGGVASGVSLPDSKTGLSRPAIPRQLKARSSYEESEPLPWVFRVPLKIVEYLFSHKIEALIYALLLYFVITVLVSMRSRGR